MALREMKSNAALGEMIYNKMALREMIFNAMALYKIFISLNYLVSLPVLFLHCFFYYYLFLNVTIFLDL